MKEFFLSPYGKNLTSYDSDPADDTSISDILAVAEAEPVDLATCSFCNGSGDGPCEGTSCSYCNGTGVSAFHPKGKTR